MYMSLETGIGLDLRLTAIKIPINLAPHLESAGDVIVWLTV